MGIEETCQKIVSLFTKVRKPFPQLSRLMLFCSMMRRPGLSTIQSVSNITKDLSKMGIPTEPMPDGSVNLTLSFVYAVVDEVFRALKKDASIQVGAQPGSISIIAEGANSGGPVIVQGENITSGVLNGMIV